mmetsp:Transcript_40527/g.91046  ORF Transcript_40527/g.91046 Transcript_40527/m.91046 type:complete len:249 (-) Transcript_40527:1081-1827(-)
MGFTGGAAAAAAAAAARLWTMGLSAGSGSARSKSKGSKPPSWVCDASSDLRRLACWDSRTAKRGSSNACPDVSNPAAPLQTPVATNSQDEFRLCEVPRRPLRGEGLGEGLLGGSLSPRPDTTGLARPLAPGTLLSKPCSLLRASSIVVSGHAAAASCFAGAGEAAAEGGASTEPPDLGLRGKELVRCLGLCPKLCRGLCPKLCTKLCRGLGSARSAGFHLAAPPRSRAAKSRAFTHRAASPAEGAWKR